jgi:hypothetical protein
MSKSYEDAKSMLESHMHSTFDELVEDYKFYSVKCIGRMFVSYEILAELVKVGWQNTRGTQE